MDFRWKSKFSSNERQLKIRRKILIKKANSVKKCNIQEFCNRIENFEMSRIVAIIQ